jgi:hypothetical protein
MFLNQPKTDKEAATPEGKAWQVIHKQFNQNGFPRSLIVDGRTWTKIQDGGSMNFTGGFQDGGFSKYGEVSINRQNTEVVEISENSIIDSGADIPKGSIAPIPGEPEGKKASVQTKPPKAPRKRSPRKPKESVTADVSSD